MIEDTGVFLRSLYKSQGGVQQVFSTKVTDYVASRPDYPAALLETLQTVCGLKIGSTVADIGAGTGLLTRSLLERGYRVVAVEPSLEMRQAADQLLSHFPDYRSVEGTAESMPLESASIELVTAATAFHWFEPEQARVECLRVLKPDGKAALIWNDRIFSDPLQVALDEVLTEFGGEKRAALATHEKQRKVSEFFRDNDPTHFLYPHEHLLDESALVSLAFSRSYMPARESHDGLKAQEKICQVFHQFSESGLVKVRYQTVACVGRPR